MQELFFELIRVSIGTADCLSHTPNADEWGKLYDIAKKQSLVGVCFAGVQKTLSSSPLKGENPSVIGMPEMLYLKWMGMAAKIQHRNEVVNRQCLELQKRLRVDGFRSCVLKGQGVAYFYSGELKGLRQSGDIDILVEGGKEKIVHWVNTVKSADEIDDHHIQLHMFPDTEVEVHFKIGTLLNRFANRRYHKWAAAYLPILYKSQENSGCINAPTIDFNLIYLLAHMHRHFFTEGLGLRQVMDYYFVLRYTQIEGFKDTKISEVQTIVNNIELEQFARGVMWVVTHIFDPNVLESLNDTLGCHDIFETDEKRGLFVLNEIMRGGNFGHYDATYKRTAGASHVQRFFEVINAGLRFVKYFPKETFWIPVDHFCHFFKIGYKH